MGLLLLLSLTLLLLLLLLLLVLLLLLLSLLLVVVRCLFIAIAVSVLEQLFSDGRDDNTSRDTVERHYKLVREFLDVASQLYVRSHAVVFSSVVRARQADQGVRRLTRLACRSAATLSSAL